MFEFQHFTFCIFLHYGNITYVKHVPKRDQDDLKLFWNSFFHSKRVYQFLNPTKMCIKSAPYQPQRSADWVISNMVLFMLWC